MSEMVERIARAMRHRAIERGFNIPTTLERHLAVAAIEAMRESTQQMGAAQLVCGDGAPETEFEIVTTRQRLVDSIHEAVEACFDDWRASGPAPPGIIVSRLISLTLERVSQSH